MPVLSVAFDLTRGEEQTSTTHEVTMYENDGHDTASATWKFCTEHNLNAKSIIGIKKSVDSRARDESLEHLVKVHQSPITKKHQ